METLLKADIFFTITSVAVVIISLVAIIALFCVLLILNELRKLMKSIRQEGENIVNDVSRIRQAIENQGWKAKEAVDSLGSSTLSVLRFVFGKKGRRRDE